MSERWWNRELSRGSRAGLLGLAAGLALVACGVDGKLEPVAVAPGGAPRIDSIEVLVPGPFGFPLMGGKDRALSPAGTQYLLIRGEGFAPGMVVWLGPSLVYSDRVLVSEDGTRIICFTPATAAGADLDVGVGRTDDFGEQIELRAVLPGAYRTLGVGSDGILLLALGIVILALLGVPLYGIIAAVTCLGLFAGAQLDPDRGFLLSRDPRQVASVPGQGVNLIGTWLQSMGESPLYVAIALLTYAGTLLSESRAPTRIVNLARAAVGWLPGGLALVAILACCMFTVFTGASGVTIIALGGLLLPLLLRERYPERFTIGLLTTGGSLGLLFYPCLPVLVYGYVTRLNVSRLYQAALIPGLLLIALLFAVSVVVSLRSGVPRHKFDLNELGRAAWAASLEIPLPIIAVGGFIMGWFTPSDLSVFTAAYVTVTLVLIHKDVPIRSFLAVVRKAAVLVGAILLIVGMSLGFGNWVSLIGVPQMILGAMQEWISDRLTFLIVLNLFLLVVGCLLDIFSATLIVVPLIAPVAIHFGVDPYHLAVVFLVNLEIGYSTPPVGINLFLASLRFRRPVTEMYRASILFIAVLALALLLLTWVPWLSLGTFGELPRVELADPAERTVKQGEEHELTTVVIALGDETEPLAAERVKQAEEALKAEEARLSLDFAKLDEDARRLQRQVEEGPRGERAEARRRLAEALEARAPLDPFQQELVAARDLLARLRKMTAEVAWRSRLDGTESTGPTFSTSLLQRPGRHTISATVRDEHGHVAQDVVVVVVEPAPPGEDDDGWDDGPR